MKAELVVFDLDGTLIDSSDDIAFAANKALRELGRRDEMDPANIKACIGWGVRVLLEGLLKDELEKLEGGIKSSEGQSLVNRAVDVFLRHYEEHLVVNTVLYPGVKETLDHFLNESVVMAICTNKPLGFTQTIVKGLAVDTYFKSIVGGDSCENKKPHPAPLLSVLQELNVAPERSVFVGDSSIDCETGKRAGVRTIGAGWGFRGRAALVEWGCETVIDNMTELVDIV